jgi:type III secretion protein U
MGHKAEQIVKMAEKFHVPIMRNVELARFLFEHASINRFIPDEAYEAVAEVLRWVVSVEADLET